MAKNRDRRRSHRSEWSDEGDHNFQEPSFFQQQPSRGLSSGVAAEVLWFNSDKGFGFVQTPDGGKAFLHVRQLEAAGYKTVAEGAAIKVVIQPGEKGPNVAEVLDIGAAPESGRAPRSQPVSSSNDRPVVGEVKGIVKFYNADKGFGFIGHGMGAKISSYMPRRLVDLAFPHWKKDKPSGYNTQKVPRVLRRVRCVSADVAAPEGHHCRVRPGTDPFPDDVGNQGKEHQARAGSQAGIARARFPLPVSFRQGSRSAGPCPSEARRRGLRARLLLASTRRVPLHDRPGGTKAARC